MFPVRKVVTDIIDVSVTLFKIMIPTLIVVKLLQEIGVVELLNHVLSPVMGVLGLPSEMAVVLTTNMLTNPYAGLIVASSLILAARRCSARTTRGPRMFGRTTTNSWTA